jgi:hypothetical protein
VSIAGILEAGGPESVEQLSAAITACVLKLATGQNLSGASLYFQVHNKATAVVEDDEPVHAWLVVDGGDISYAPVGEGGIWDGLKLSEGCQLAWSTTQDTFTAPAAAPGPLTATTRAT